MPFDAHANLAASTVAVAPAPAGSGTTLSVAAGQGALFPTAPFNAVIWPGSQQVPTAATAEIVRVIAMSGDNITTMVRATSTEPVALGPIAIGVGYHIVAAVTAKTLTDIEGATGGGGGLVIPHEYASPAGATAGEIFLDDTSGDLLYAWPTGGTFDLMAWSNPLTWTNAALATGWNPGSFGGGITYATDFLRLVHVRGYVVCNNTVDFRGADSTITTALPPIPGGGDPSMGHIAGVAQIPVGMGNNPTFAAHLLYDPTGTLTLRNVQDAAGNPPSPLGSYSTEMFIGFSGVL